MLWLLLGMYVLGVVILFALFYWTRNDGGERASEDDVHMAAFVTFGWPIVLVANIAFGGMLLLIWVLTWPFKKMAERN